MRLPDARTRHPLIFPDGSRHQASVYLNQAIDHPNWSIGDYSYAHDETRPEDWAAQLAPYLYAGAPERLTIGRFAQIAQGARFITQSANHQMTGVSTYPFGIFDPERFASFRGGFAQARDTVIGNDVWIGAQAMILPGARLGDGVIVGARAVVGGRVPDYAVVAGNPAQIVRMRFNDDEIETLKRLAWWDWPKAAIETAISALETGDVAALARLAPQA